MVNLALPEFDPSLPDFVAEAIGDESLSPLVADIVRLSIRGLYLFHGPKREQCLKEIAEQGVKPLTPEGHGGPSSFWTAHKRLFASSIDPNGIGTFDTSFFQYAHLRTDEPGKLSMALVVTTIPKLYGTPMTVTPDEFRRGYIQLHATVPPEAVDILVADQQSDESLLPRQNGQLIERDMLLQLHDYLSTDLQ